MAQKPEPSPTEDNLYPLNGAAFAPTEPIEQQQERDAEKGKLLEALPLVEDIINHFKDRVDFYGSVDSIPDEVKTKPDEFLIIHNANQLVRDNLVVEIEWLEGLLAEYLKR